MAKRSFKRVMSLFLVIATILALSAAPVAAKSGTHKYWCRAHSSKTTDMYVTLTATFSGKKATSAYFSGSYTHWPNGVSFGSTAKCTGYARGTYTMYSSLITQWVSLAFQSKTATIYVYK